MIDKFLDFHDFMMAYHPYIYTITGVILVAILAVPVSMAIIWFMFNFPWLIGGTIILAFTGYIAYCIIDYFKNWR